MHLDAHIAFLEKCYAKGSFIASGRKVPRTGGVILAQAGSKAEVEMIIQQVPFYIKGMANYEITEFIASMASKEFEAIKSFV